MRSRRRAVAVRTSVGCHERRGCSARALYVTDLREELDEEYRADCDEAG